MTECHGLDTPERVCFYEQDFYVLSNFSSFSIKWPGVSIRFPTSEHLYHWLKFNPGSPYIKDAPLDPFAGARPWIRKATETIAAMIADAPSAQEAFKIAQEGKEFCRADWDEVKVDFMRQILVAKAEQHEYVRRKLLATGDRLLVENSWRDDYWGWGPNRDGQNMLGTIWMELRTELRSREDRHA